MDVGKKSTVDVHLNKVFIINQYEIMVFILQQIGCPFVSPSPGPQNCFLDTSSVWWKKVYKFGK